MSVKGNATTTNSGTTAFHKATLDTCSSASLASLDAATPSTEDIEKPTRSDIDAGRLSVKLLRVVALAVAMGDAKIQIILKSEGFDIAYIGMLNRRGWEILNDE